MSKLKEKFIEHNSKTRQIYQKPKIIGLENIIFSTNEVTIFKPNGDIYRQPDNLLIDVDKKIVYNIELKLQNQYKKACCQLKESAKLLKIIYPGYRIQNIYVDGKFNTRYL